MLGLAAICETLSAQSQLVIRRSVTIESELRADRSYQLEASEDGENWRPIGAAVSGHFGLYSWHHPADSNAIQIYRILEGEPLLDEFEIPGIGLRMVAIPAGQFTMGSSPSELGRDSAEGPQQAVEISESFWMGRSEVTQADWRVLMPDNPSQFRGDHLPVETVSWEAALEFCQRLTEKERDAGRLEEGFVYRLPTEAEWEYASRAGTDSRFYWGDDLSLVRSGDYAWTAENSNGETQTVGRLAANPFGLYDSAGNVAEWVLDRFGEYSGDAAVDPLGPEAGEARVFRGGSWLFDADFGRSAARGALDPADANAAIGFRVVLGRDFGSGGGVRAMRNELVVDLLPQVEIPNDTMQLLRVEPGVFLMGSLPSESGRSAHEGPPRLVTITTPFWMGTHEVTQAQYELVIGENPSQLKGPLLPVEGVTWDQARMFCERLTDQGRASGDLGPNEVYRLPTEAEWEYVCRAGTSTPFAFGDSLDSTQANFDGSKPYGSGQIGVVLGMQTEVGSYAPNAWGFYDLHGNVWEWCSDFYNPTILGGEDPVGPSSGSHRVVRGGDFLSDGLSLRSANRLALKSSWSGQERVQGRGRGETVRTITRRCGFRVVRGQPL